MKRIITGDEKWIIYDNPTRKRLWIKKGEKAQAIAKWIDEEEGDVRVVGLEGNRSLRAVIVQSNN